MQNELMSDFCFLNASLISVPRKVFWSREDTPGVKGQCEIPHQQSMSTESKSRSYFRLFIRITWPVCKDLNSETNPITQIKATNWLTRWHPLCVFTPWQAAHRVYWQILWWFIRSYTPFLYVLVCGLLCGVCRSQSTALVTHTEVDNVQSLTCL